MSQTTGQRRLARFRRLQVPMFEDPDLVGATILDHVRAHAVARHAHTA